jgi:hypothetical protein
MALLEARTKGRSLRDTARVFLGSCTVGMFAPGIAYGIMRYWLKWIPDEAVPFITWHYWAGAGLLASLFGWGLLHKLNIVFNNRADKFLHISPEEAETRKIE